MENLKLQLKIKNFIEEWRWIFLFGLGILILFFILRLTNLTILPIFADEAIYIRWSQVMKAESTLRFLPLSDGKQPLFMWMLMPLLGLLQDPLVAGRILSVFSGLVTMAGIFLLSIIIYRSKLVALISAFFYVIIPFALFFDRLSLVDSLLASFGVWVLLLGILLVENPRLDLGMITGLVLGGALLTKSPAIFFALLLPTTTLLLKSKFNKELIHKILVLIGLWIVIYFFAFAVYNILRLGPSYHMIALRNKDYVFSFKEVLSHPLDPFKPHIGQVLEWFKSLVGWPLIIAFFFSVIFGIKKFSRKTILLLLWFFIPLFTQMAIAKVFTARYIFFTIPFFLVICSSGIFWLINFLKGKSVHLKVSLILLVLGILCFEPLRTDYLLLTNPQRASLPEDERVGYLEEWTSGYGINEVRDYLLKVAKDRSVVVGTEGYFGTLPDGLQIYFDKQRSVTIIGVGLALDKIPAQLKESASKGTPTYLVVNKSRMRAQNDPGLNLIFEAPKARGKKGQDFLLFYQVK